MSDDKTNLTLTGVVHAIPPPRTYNDKTYPNLVLEIDPGKYPQYPKLECRDSLSGLVANLGVGSTVKVYINIRGREYTNKTTGVVDWFTSVQVYKLDIIERVAKAGGVDNGLPPSGGLDDEDPMPF
jgi:hypothetical protein